MTFAELNLDPKLLKAVKLCGYSEPTPIQARTIPEALAGRDLLAGAQTGTGKTAGFMLPALQRLLISSERGKGAPRVLVLTPTRELASQVMEAARTYGKYISLKTALLLGGMSYRNQFSALGRQVDLVVATPGRLIDHMVRGSIDLSHVEILVLDEADRMLDMGFKDAVERIIAAAPAKRQTMLFTATLGSAVTRLTTRLLNDPVRVDIPGKTVTLEQIDQRLFLADNFGHKYKMLRHLVADNGVTRAIIFSATKRGADRLARDLSADGHKAEALHGDMNQGARDRTLRALRKGRVRLLVATDVAARGLDVTGISHVINFDLPMFAEDYVHRIGRTGRAGASGIAISFVSSSDWSALYKIQRYIGQNLPRHVIAGIEPTQSMRKRSRKRGGHAGSRIRPWGYDTGSASRKGSR